LKAAEKTGKPTKALMASTKDTEKRTERRRSSIGAQRQESTSSVNTSDGNSVVSSQDTQKKAHGGRSISIAAGQRRRSVSSLHKSGRGLGVSPTHVRKEKLSQEEFDACGLPNSKSPTSPCNAHGSPAQPSRPRRQYISKSEVFQKLRPTTPSCRSRPNSKLRGRDSKTKVRDRSNSPNSEGADRTNVLDLSIFDGVDLDDAYLMHDDIVRADTDVINAHPDVNSYRLKTAKQKRRSSLQNQILALDATSSHARSESKSRKARKKDDLNGDMEPTRSMSRLRRCSISNKNELDRVDTSHTRSKSASCGSRKTEQELDGDTTHTISNKPKMRRSSNGQEEFDVDASHASSNAKTKENLAVKDSMKAEILDDYWLDEVISHTTRSKSRTRRSPKRDDEDFDVDRAHSRSRPRKRRPIKG